MIILEKIEIQILIINKQTIVVSPPQKSNKNIPPSNIRKNTVLKSPEMNQITVNITKIKRKSYDIKKKKDITSNKTTEE